LEMNGYSFKLARSKRESRRPKAEPLSEEPALGLRLDHRGRLITISCHFIGNLSFEEGLQRQGRRRTGSA
jgi:hypothetical protein